MRENSAFDPSQARVRKRLIPLKIATFFHGIMLWNAIEIVFMNSIGFTPSTVALAAIVSNVVILSAEIPSGIIADRWSRKKLLVIAGFVDIVFLLISLSANSVPVYILALAFGGFYIALNSGLVDTIVYDTLLEETGSRAGFEKHLGVLHALRSAGLVLGSLLGGLVGQYVSLRSTYLWTLPGSIIFIFALTFLREPTVHIAEDRTEFLHQFKETLVYVFAKGYARWIVISMLCLGVLSTFVLELDQLWLLAVAQPLIWYGPVNALLLLVLGLAGPIADRVTRSRSMFFAVGILSLFSGALLTLNHRVAVIFGLTGSIMLLSALLIFATGKLHDSIPSNLRSGAVSSVGTATTLVFLPVVFVFGKLTSRYSIFSATFVFIPLYLAAFLGLYSISRQVKNAR